MSKRFIAIERRSEQVRIAVAINAKTGPVLQKICTVPWQENMPLGEQIDQVLDDPLRSGDRLAMALPASSGLVRELKFPFGDEKKLAAAIPLELDNRLPVSLDQCQVSYRQLRKPAENQHSLSAAAVKSQIIADAIAPFDKEQLPLALVDLQPFATVDGLRGQMPESLLILLHGEDSCLLLVNEGNLIEFRYAPLPQTSETDRIMPWLERQARSLLAAHRMQSLGVTLLGDAVPEDLAIKLQENDWQVSALRLPGLSQAPTTAELPVAALALRLAQPPRDRGLNFRSGPFALKSEWRRLQKQLISAGAIFLVGSLLFAIGAWTNYSSLSRQADRLQTQMVEKFRQSFPKEKAIIDVPLQMQSKIASLEKQLIRFGGKGDFSPLKVLEKISSGTPKDLTVEIKNYNYTPDQVRLEGRTTTFDAVDRLTDNLKKTKLFSEVRITDAKLTLDGKQVDFRLSLDHLGREGQP